MKKFDELSALCQNRCLNFSLTWQKMTDWSVEIYTGHIKSYEKKFYTDGHTNKKEAIKKAIKYMKSLDNRVGYLGAKVEPRKSFADKIKHTRKITYKGIPYKNKNYTFDGWENHIGEIINFEVFDDYLILNLEGQILHATTQDI